MGLAAATPGSLLGGAQALQAPEHAAVLARLGRYVEQYYFRAQRVVAEEVVTLQRLRADMTFDGPPRRLMYELRVEWNPGAAGQPAANVMRQLISVSGRPPRPGHEPECLDPPALSPEPLAGLLPSRRDEFTFTSAGRGRISGRAALIFEYQPIAAARPTITWRDTCASIDAPGQTKRRVWIDPDSAAVLRLDERIVGEIPIPVPPAQRRLVKTTMTLERAESSIRYALVTFNDPDETVLLPAQIDSITISRDSGVPRLRTTQTFSKYRRFVTDSRVVPN